MVIELYATKISDLTQSVPRLIQDAMPHDRLAAATVRGAFRPEEDEQIGDWFSRYLRLRRDLWDVINEMDEQAGVELKNITTKKEWRCLVIGFSAACLLVRLHRFLVFEFATHTITQRKLNEAFPEYKIRRKQYSRIYAAYSDPTLMMSLYQAVRFCDKNAQELAKFEQDKVVGSLVQNLPRLQLFLNKSKRSFMRRLVTFFVYKWRRRGASAKQKTSFAVFEVAGRFAAKMNPGKVKLVTPDVLGTLSAELQPGDVIVTRHRYALTNYFLPGTWPHASLYIGTEIQREEWGINVAPPIAHRWKNDRCTLEALRDGVLFRPLAETMKVDAYAVLRPNLSKEGIRRSIERVVKHEGKRYKFDFDFFNSDRLVCTEVVYRAFDGIEAMRIPLTERAGRQTLTAEDLLDLSLDTELFSLWSVFGFPTLKNLGPHYQEEATQILARSYR